MRRCRQIGLGFVAAAALAGAAQAHMQQAFLVQNSGWMEPFYADPSSGFKSLIATVINTVAAPDDPVFVSAFNQSVPGAPSPHVVYSGLRAATIGAALDSIGVAAKPASSKLADTDFQEAVQHTVVEQFGGRSGILWIFTNNKNSPNNSPDTIQRNRDFYALLHDEPSIVAALAVPRGMRVQGKFYSAQGLMIYALAYGAPAGLRLRQIAASQAFRTLFNAPAARLKPLDENGARFVPLEVRNAPGVRMSLGTDQRTLLLDVDLDARKPTVEILASVENLLFPYVIRSADLAARVNGRGWQSSLGITPAHLANLQPDSAQQAKVLLPLPTSAVPSVWSVRALSLLGKSYIIPANIEISLTNQTLEVAGSFTERLAAIFPGDPLSEIFLPPQRIHGSTTRLPLLIRITYPVYPLFVVIGAVLVLLGGAIALLTGATGVRRYEVTVNGESRKIAVQAFREVVVYSSAGVAIGALKRTFGAPAVVRASPGNTIVVR